MSLFLDEPVTATKRPAVNTVAVISLIVAVTGFLNILGFLVGPILGIIALSQIRRTGELGRGLALWAIWLSILVVIAAVVAILIYLVAAYAALPSPQF